MRISKNLKSTLIQIHWFFSAQLGLNAIIFCNAARALPSYLHNFIEFRKKFSGEISLLPCLHDKRDSAGVTNNEYFWQDLIVARLINVAKPIKHVDVGSRIDGFVAHLASFREVEVFDIRPLGERIPGVTFHKSNMMSELSLQGIQTQGYCESLSCLHAIEHFGLGRYGDPINPLGYERGISNMSKMLKKDGLLYLSTGIGRERVMFNSGWIFDPRTIIETAKKVSLSLQSLTVIESGGKLSSISLDDVSLAELTFHNYKLGLFVFIKGAQHENK